MTAQEILEKIINEDGSCDWVNDHGGTKVICSQCPLSYLKKRSGNNYFCCADALGITISRERKKRANHIYKRAAEQLLFDMIAEEMLDGAE